MLKAYKEIYREFEWQSVTHYNFVKDVIYKYALEQPQAPALIWTDTHTDVTLNFSELKNQANKTAAVLARSDLKRGDVVLLILSRELAWWQVILGCLQLGIIVSPGTKQLTEKDITYRLKASGAKAIISTIDLAPIIDSAVGATKIIKFCVGGQVAGWENFDTAFKDASPYDEVADTKFDEHALYYFTSGTTGEPKMTVHGHGYPLGHETTGRFWVEAAPGKVIWNISDTGWAKAAWTSLFAPWLCGAAIFALHREGFDPQITLACLEKYPVTTLCAPPTAYRMFVRGDVSGRSFKKLERCVSAGEPLNPEVIELWQKQTSYPIFEGYGQTETVILCGSFKGMELRPGSMGLPAPGIDLNVIDNAGNPVEPNQEGDIAVRISPNMPRGMFLEYKDDPQRTAQSFKNGWYLTGDRATKDDDGYFWFVGRSDDVILSSGYRIGPFEVESVLFEHEAVAESAVVASPDPIRGEVVKAFIILTPHYTPTDELVEQLQTYVKNATAPYKYPRKIEFVQTLPKTISGKIKRNELKKKEWENVN